MTLVACTDSSTCASGLVCAPYSPSPSLPGFNCPARTCQPSCDKAGCASDEVCGADGVCRLTKCDEPGAPACAEHYRCDPAAAPAMVTTVVNGSSATDAAAPQHEAQRGCIRKLCDEPDGFVCKDNWSCDPANVPVNEGSGCVPLSCKETGHCQDDSLSICEPTNDGPRAAGTDLHGCVVRNCGEGRVCRHIKDSVNYAYCDLESPEADAAGCVVKSCEEMPEVCSGRICDRGSPIGDAFGCRALDCHDPGGPSCPDGTLCELASAMTGVYSCRSTASGGTGGGGPTPPRGGSAGGPAGGTAGLGAGGAAGSGTGGALITPVTGGRSSGGSSSTAGKTGTGGTTLAGDASGICVARE